MKDIIIKNIIFKDGSYQNKMLVLTNCTNVLSSSFTSMQSFLNILLVRKKLTREKYRFCYQRTTNSTRREKENETLQKAGLGLAKLVHGGINLKKKQKTKLPEEWKENFRMFKESLYKLCDELHIYLVKQKTQFRDLSLLKSKLLVHYFIKQMKED